MQNMNPIKNWTINREDMKAFKDDLSKIINEAPIKEFIKNSPDLETIINLILSFEKSKSNSKEQFINNLQLYNTLTLDKYNEILLLRIKKYSNLINQLLENVSKKLKNDGDNYSNTNQYTNQYKFYRNTLQLLENSKNPKEWTPEESYSARMTDYLIQLYFKKRNEHIQNMNQNMMQNVNANLNPNLNTNVNSNINPNMNTNLNPNVNPSMLSQAKSQNIIQNLNQNVGITHTGVAQTSISNGIPTKIQIPIPNLQQTIIPNRVQNNNSNMNQNISNLSSINMQNQMQNQKIVNNTGNPNGVPNGTSNGIGHIHMESNPNSKQSLPGNSNFPPSSRNPQMNQSQRISGTNFQGGFQGKPNSGLNQQKQSKVYRHLSFINSLKTFENQDQNEMLEDLMNSIQNNRENPENLLFNDLIDKKVNSLVYKKRKRRKLNYGEENIVNISPYSQNDTNINIQKKKSFFSNPHILRDYSNFGQKIEENQSKVQQMCFAPKLFKIMNLIAKGKFVEKIDKDTDNIYYQYYSNSEKHRKLSIYFDHSSDCSSLYRSLQVFRLVESLKVQHPDSNIGSIWKEQEIFLNANPTDLIKQYYLISSSIDKLRTRLCNDISCLMENVVTFKLPVEKEELSADFVASANGIGYIEPIQDVVVELRTYHHGRRYLTPYIECRITLRKTIILPSFIVEMDYYEESPISIFPVGKHKFLNSKTILGDTPFFRRAKKRFDKEIEKKINALHVVKDWIRIVIEEAKNNTFIS